jgi:NADH:ubiquinone oxidoreductase subunit D
MSLTGFEVEVQRKTEGGGLITEDMTLSMGPQHPSTHGVLRFIVRADGEVMKEAIPDIGYLHRSIEKIAEKVGWHGFIPQYRPRRLRRRDVPATTAGRRRRRSWAASRCRSAASTVA